MNKFFKNIIYYSLIFIFSLLFVISGVIYLNYDHKVDYPAAIMNKYQRLDSLKNTKKAIICGGSSSCYSINSKDIQDSLNIPVVNTSLAMSLGSEFHLNMVRDYLCKGDIVIYIPEYEFYYGKEEGDDFLYTTSFYYPPIIKDFTDEQKKTLYIKSVRLSVDYYLGKITKIKLKKKVIELFQKNENSSKKSKISQYNRKSYNYLGDNTSLDTIRISKVKRGLTSRFDRLQKSIISEKFVSFLKKLNDECLQKGVKLYITFPPIEESQYDERFVKGINYVRNLTKIEFIGEPKEYIYEANLFYDSSYHLNGGGKELRSERFVKNLMKKMN